MQLAKNLSISDSLRERDSFFENTNLMCWKKTEEKINIHAFSFVFETQDLLVESYADIRDRIAIYFQGQLLESTADRWNIYIFFFLNAMLDPEKKQMIEQDKFSSRKFVIDKKDFPQLQEGSFDDASIEKSINQELFDLDITRKPADQISLDEVLALNYEQVYNVVGRFGYSANLETLLKAMSNE